MGEVIKVGMADLKTAKAPNTLTTLGLGSCIGLTLYDPVTKVRSFQTCMHPPRSLPQVFSDLLPKPESVLKVHGFRYPRILQYWYYFLILCCLAAYNVPIHRFSSVGNVGARNAEEAKIILKELRIPLIAEDTGLNYGRTVELDCETGDFRIKSVGKEIKVI